MNALRLVAGLVLGGLTAWLIMALGFFLLRSMWPDYVLAEPEKTFTLAMLFARLSIFALLTAGAACVAPLVAGDNGRAAWLIGAALRVRRLTSR